MIASQKQIIQVHQCAWCKCFMIDGVRIDSRSIDTDAVDSHGICITCAFEVEAQYYSDDTEA